MLKGGISSGGSQPPKNRIDIIVHISTMFMYSPTMKRRYGVEEYSTMKPATSSDSASGRSKGGRLVSASAEMKNTTNIGNKGPKKFHCQKFGPCTFTISEMLSEPAYS